MKHLVLFDIDGTLLHPGGAGRASMRRGLTRAFGTAGEIETFKFGGMLDRYLVGALMEPTGLSLEQIDDQMEVVHQAMAEELQIVLDAGDHDIQACPGTHQLIETLHQHKDVTLGLLTGNFRQTAHIKVRAAGFDSDNFRVGAYGGEASDRADLPAIAVGRAETLTGQTFRGKQIVIIGDTVHDVTCGRGIGARSIAVMTGWDTRQQIEAVNPDFLFDDLSDAKQVISAILA